MPNFCIFTACVPVCVQAISFFTQEGRRANGIMPMQIYFLKALWVHFVCILQNSCSEALHSELCSFICFMSQTITSDIKKSTCYYGIFY